MSGGAAAAAALGLGLLAACDRTEPAGVEPGLVASCAHHPDQPGNWSLTADLASSSACLEILSDDVTLDCAGHTISGAASGAGIRVVERARGRISGCTIRDFHDGIDLERSHDATLAGNTFRDNVRYGVYLLYGSGASLQSNHVEGNGDHGIFLRSSPDNTLDGNTARGNRNSGLYLSFSGTTGNLVANNVSFDNAFYGIYMGGGADTNVIRDNRVRDNAEGLRQHSAVENLYQGNLSERNTWGIRLLEGSDGNILRGNHVLENAFGIVLTGSESNLVHDNVFENEMNAMSDRPNLWNVEPACGGVANVLGGPCLGG
ncbi:MAG TPA: NosD domain-containing protein, partial [Gemmatimonadota bacterium]|nr:NosD domain-containing protein [Gemmatimonadota bacterium]